MFTGERILPGGKFNVTYQQSLFAYDVVRGWAAGKSILDVGFGEGYGSAYLAEVAREVVGVDYNAATVREATERYARPNLTFKHADVFDLPAELTRKKFDIVCSFQTIEHMDDQERFVKILQAQTAPGGMVIMTTPNRLKFPSFNPYHVREFAPEELRELLSRHFPSVQVHGVFGDAEVLEYRAAKQTLGNLILRVDVLQAREWLPRPFVRGIYGAVSNLLKLASYRSKQAVVDDVTLENFSLSDTNLKESLDLLAVGKV